MSSHAAAFDCDSPSVGVLPSSTPTQQCCIVWSAFISQRRSGAALVEELPPMSQRCFASGLSRAPAKEPPADGPLQASSHAGPTLLNQPPQHPQVLPGSGNGRRPPHALLEP